jgi:tRNA-specific 2-thiouridylase
MAVKNAIEKIKRSFSNKSYNDIHFGISGGVDSSALAVLIKESGFKIRGFHAVCWDEGNYCTAPEDLKDALSVTSMYDIPIEILNLKNEYRDYVLRPFIQSYEKGYVANIDILCNQFVKFGMVYERLISGSNDILSTGHYASVGVLPLSLTGGAETKALKIPKDESKDQTYFLSHIIRNPEIINHVFFPGSLFSKTEIRELAVELGLPNADKPDSQGICFIGNVEMRTFLANYIKPKEGNIVDTAGNIVGKHTGAAFFAIGQRHGFELAKYSSEPLYIVQKDPAENLLVVGPREEAFFDHTYIVDFFSILDEAVLNDLIKQKKLQVRFRNLGKLLTVKNLEKNSSEKYLLNLEEPEFGLTPGQEAVFYTEKHLIGSGTIDFK